MRGGHGIKTEIKDKREKRNYIGGGGGSKMAVPLSLSTCLMDGAKGAQF